MPSQIAPGGERDSNAERDSASDEELDAQEQDQHQRDMLAGTQTAAALQILGDAIAEPSAFVQPSAQIADIARRATKVCIFRQRVAELHIQMQHMLLLHECKPTVGMLALVLRHACKS